jgi:pimeloyl-ACP methyl ester carboxylesterase
MARATRLVRSLFRLILPVILLTVAAVCAASVWLVYTTARPKAAKYLVTPEKYGRLSARGAQVTDESWSTADGTQSRGWLLRGAEGAPAVILFHKYGADRSHVLNLGVKLNESTDFTVLMPDLRAHGENPKAPNSGFGGCETEDAVSAVQFVRNLKTPAQQPLVGASLGVYGVELGAISAMMTAAKDKTVKAIALDSMPEVSDQVLSSAVGRRYPFASAATTSLARLGTYLYYFDGCYRHDSYCDMAKQITDARVLLLAGLDASEYQDSSSRLAKCFAGSTNVQTKLDLSPSGFSIITASMEQSEAYDQRVIDFFRSSLGN